MKLNYTDIDICAIGRSLLQWTCRTGVLAAALVLLPQNQSNAQSTTPPSGYCNATHANSGNNGCVGNYGFHFLKVGVDNWVHNVQCNTSTVYRYWSNLGNVLTLSQGGNYTMMLQTASTTYQTGGAMWIDYNQDGTFSASEYVGTNSTGGSAPTFYKQFTVPCSALPGQTIMRFRCDYNLAVGPNHGCGASPQNYGETMDFIVTITATNSLSCDFNLPDTVYTGSPARFVNVNQVGYVSHHWDVLNYGGNPDATSTNLTWTFPSAGNYQVKLTSTNCKGTAFKTKSVTVVDPTSAPTPQFVLSKNHVIYNGVDPILVDFVDLSSGGPSAWYWIVDPDWLNGAPYFWASGSEFDQAPTGFFYDVQKYDVCLVVSNSAGSDTLCKPGYLDIAEPGSGSAFTNILGEQTGSSRDSGFIYDSGGPLGPYDNNEYETFLIAPCAANQVRLNFIEFNLGTGDNLSIYDGTSASAKLLGTYGGTNLPPQVVSTGGAMFLVFVSDNGNPSSGFKATWGSSMPNNGPPTADFMVPDTVYECAIGNEVLFKNTSTGVIQTEANYDWIFDFDPNVSYPAGYADVKDETNPIYQYIGTGNYQVRMVLKSCEGNDTIVKQFILASTLSNPQADFTTSATIAKVGDVITLEDASVAGCELTWVITPNTYTIENGGTVNDKRIEVKFTQPGSYHVKLIVDNDNGSSFRERTNHINVIEYCTPGVFYPNVADAGINQVIIGNEIDNESASGQIPGYTNYEEDFQMEMILGQTYNFTVSRNGNVNAVDRKIWIDYNRDGDFNDAGELVASQTGSKVQIFTGSFTVPGLSGVTPGPTRLRVGVSLTGTALPGCGPTQAGEYEDYGIILTPDNIAPIITMIGGDEIVEVNTTYTDQGATAWDNIEGDITGSIVVDNGVDMSQAGVYLVTYNVTDLSGNVAATVIRKVTVVNDLTKPVLTLIGANPLPWAVLVPFADPGATATDDPGAVNIDHLITVSGTVDVNTIGDYNLVYSVYDNFGNQTEVTRVVQVRDLTAPTIVGGPVVNVQVGAPFSDPVMAVDDFEETAQLVYVDGPVVNPNVVGTYVVTYTAVDASGNQAANMDITYVVADYIPPTINYTGGTEVVVIDVFDLFWKDKPGMEVTATDNYYDFAELEVIYPSGFSVNKLGVYVIVYKATDDGGNVTIFERTLHVVDRINPVVVTEPLNLHRWAGPYDFTTGVLVQDNYNTPTQFATGANGCTLLVLRNNVDYNYPGLYEVSYVAIDESGNRSKETIRTVQVSEEGAMTGMGDQLENRISVYPNPSNGVFTVQVNGITGDDFRMEIVDALGKSVQVLDAGALVDGKVTVNLSGIASGVYFVRVSSGSQNAVKRITIQ